MKKSLLVLMLILFAALPAAAQTFEFAFLLGRARGADDGFELSFPEPVRELSFSAPIDFQTRFRVKAGAMDAENEQGLGDQPTADGKIEYIDALVGYDFDEIFGKTTLFAGPGYYRQRFGDLEETDWGLSAGINGTFPVTRRFALVAEAAYHYAHFEQVRSFVTIAGGVQIGF